MERKLNQRSRANGQKLELTICHLYPDLMDTYGDKGNITAIRYRCGQRGIKVKYTPLTINAKLSTNFDFFFFGGGQDQAQEIVWKDLQEKASLLKKAIDDGSVLLSICGGYQLLQNYFKTAEGTKIPGIGLFNAYTQGADTRFMNNLLIDLNPNINQEIKSTYQSNNLTIYQSTLIGFENHSGKTYLGPDTDALGTVIKGNGNNGQDKTEGAIYKNAFGTYLHGSLLPKNPHFADYLISKALGKKYGKVKLQPLDDTLEWLAHNEIIDKVRRSG